MSRLVCRPSLSFDVTSFWLQAYFPNALEIPFIVLAWRPSQKSKSDSTKQCVCITFNKANVMLDTASIYWLYRRLKDWCRMSNIFATKSKQYKWISAGTHFEIEIKSMRIFTWTMINNQRKKKHRETHSSDGDGDGDASTMTFECQKIVQCLYSLT